MTSIELRQNIKVAYEMTHGGESAPDDFVTTVMQDIKNHVDYVIGNDAAESVLNGVDVTWFVNAGKAEQRNRAGGY